MKTYLLLLIFLLSSIISNAQQPGKINSIQELADSIGRIAHKRSIPGLMVSIATRDSVLFSGGFGYADLKNKRAVNSRTLFRLGSITKSFVAIAILKLVEQGKLDLNDRLRDLAPDVPFTNAWETSNPVRIVNLLENTTGFDDFKFNKMYSLDRKQYDSKEMMLQQKASMICRWRPSERYTYCNVNYAILGYIIRKITGKEYDQYLTENILMPLGMGLSNFDSWSRHPDQDTREYSQASGQIKEVPSVTLLPAAAGSLWSCADDMTKFLQLFLQNGRPVLSEESLKRIELPTSSLAARAGLSSGYALGNEDFGIMRGHDGILGTCRSSFRYNRELGYGFVLSSNSNGLGNIENLINDYMSRHGNIERPSQSIKTQPLDKTQITPYLGYYQAEDPRYDLLAFTDRLLLLKVEIKNDTLQFNILGRKHQLLQIKPLVFTQPGAAQAEIAFATNADGKKVLIINKHYTEKVSAIKAFSWRISIALALIFAMLSVLLGLIALVYLLVKKKKAKSLHMFILPMTGVAALIWGALAFMKIKNDGYRLFQLGTPSFISISIFIGFTLFGICALLNVAMVFRRLKAVPNLFVKGILVVTAFSLLLIAYILFVSGWIGLVTWKL